jgi:RNA polymerase subunit RPABC4/transcription elongation factor Spt4
MAELKPCSDCGVLVSTKAPACPHCGTDRPTKAGHIRWLVLIVLGTGAISALIDRGPPQSPSTGTTAVTVECLSVPQALIDNISSGLSVQGGGRVSRASAVRSGAPQNAYFVSGSIEGSGLDNTVAVWATTSLEGAGMIFSVNAMAGESSVFPDGGQADAEFSMSDPGARDSESCLR